MPHIPVLLKEVCEYLDPKPGEFIIDGTVDGGGHAAEIVNRISPGGKFLGVDLDREMIDSVKTKLLRKHVGIKLVRGNYADLPAIIAGLNFPPADGLLLDLGFSSDQLEGRGFTFLKDEPLLMTYDNSLVPVRSILKNIREDELADIIRRYGEERLAKRIAGAICRSRPIETTGKLRRIIEKAAPSNYEKGRIHPATRTFQALRIYANGELENLKAVLEKVPMIVARGGRIAMVSFHSLEDRIVKIEFRKMEKGGILKLLNKKPVRPSAEETAANPRSRSAKLRAAIRL